MKFELLNKKYDEFIKAYDEYPSQDNEGFIPDRGGFKCGFMSAWDVRQKEIDRLHLRLSEAQHYKAEKEELRGLLAEAFSYLRNVDALFVQSLCEKIEEALK